MNTQILIDKGNNVLHTFNHSWGNMNKSRSLTHRFSGLNPNTLPRGESSSKAFLLPVTSVSRYRVRIRIPAKWGKLQTDVI